MLQGERVQRQGKQQPTLTAIEPWRTAALGEKRQRGAPIYGTRMAAAGTPRRTLQGWMGHRDYKTTEIYAEFAPEPTQGALWAQRAFGDEPTDGASVLDPGASDA